MNEQDQAKAIEKANAYRQMFGNWAWKDFELILRDTRQAALEKMVYASKMDDVYESRGVVHCIDGLHAELDSITTNLK